MEMQDGMLITRTTDSLGRTIVASYPDKATLDRIRALGYAH